MLQSVLARWTNVRFWEATNDAGMAELGRFRKSRPKHGVRDIMKRRKP